MNKFLKQIKNASYNPFGNKQTRERSYGETKLETNEETREQSLYKQTKLECNEETRHQSYDKTKLESNKEETREDIDIQRVAKNRSAYVQLDTVTDWNNFVLVKQSNVSQTMTVD